MTITRTCSLTVAVLALALSAGACGDSNQDEVRAAALAATEAFERTISGDRQRQACELMTPRAAAQLAAIVDADDCTAALSGRDMDFARHSAAEFAKASVEVREDRVVIAIGGLGERVGLRRIGGEWLVDNIVIAIDGQPGKPDPRLAQGSEVQQVQATVNALSAALDGRDHERACTLFSHGAEAQIVVGAGGAESGAALVDRQQQEPVTCASALRTLVKHSGEEDPFAHDGRPLDRIDAAQVSVRGGHATVDIGGLDAQELIRQDGRWVVDGGLTSFSVAEHVSASDLKRCWQRSGAAIASDASDLRFAAGRKVRDLSDGFDRVSVKGDGWRVFYAQPTNGTRVLYARRVSGDDPGLVNVLAKPDIVPVVAYIEDATARPDVVRKARACAD